MVLLGVKACPSDEIRLASLGSKMNMSIMPRHLLRLAAAMGALLLLAFLHMNFNGEPSPMTEAVRSSNKTALCTDFDPALVSEKLHSLIEHGGHAYTNDEISDFVCTIMNHRMDLTAKLDCSTIISSRYEHLQRLPSTSRPQIQYFFALDLHQAVHVILPLMGSIIQAIRYLGPQHCALSIVEGRSTDGTYGILAGLKTELASLGVPYFLTRSYLDPKAAGEDRITVLAHLRNVALTPLLQESQSKTSRLSRTPSIIFINDIVLCPEDILELLHQQTTQSASMSCAFDWNSPPAAPGQPGSFYDSWVSRSMSGNLFFEVTHDASHWLPDDMFFDHPASASRWAQALPIQVYSCWGGMVVLDAEPFLSGQIAFRSAEKQEECFMGEPMTLARDLWRLGNGRGRILAVPTVNVAYEYADARAAKEARGYVARIVEHKAYNVDAERVDWKPSPPPMVKCMPVFERQWWVSSV
ncbi:cryptococcal mannosyltransferase 1-domain-containing protein [Aspergillus egyptiacus]|nr:cryptococcal mannosyltransferase 1-domain-containing protein [Aspergillus egyptiacus]